MGPWEEYGDELARELSAYRRQHPGVIIKEPLETMSRLWEVSSPRSTMAFDDPELMLRALRMTSIHKE
jgi:hypothetical protein